METPTPICYGHFTGGQDAAERGCESCLKMPSCKQLTAAAGLDGPVQRPFKAPAPTPPKKTAGDILDEMAQTYRERNAVYGDNYKMVAKLVAVLFPKGVPPELVVADQWHLFELKLVKISRFAISNLTHQDSIHDDGVYSAMIEAIIIEQGTAK